MRNATMVFAVVFAAAGCAPPAVRERVVLLPAPDGSVGELIVQSDRKNIVLNARYAGAEVVGDKLQERTYTEQEVKQRFADAMGALPQRVRAYLFYFDYDSMAPTRESFGVIDEVRDELTRRPGAEVIVIGHTDRVGTGPYNDQLSLKRAESVRDILVKAGIPTERIETFGRGEREPLVETPDETPEPRNRRVEIKLR